MDTTGVRLGFLLALTIPAPGLTQEPELEPHFFPPGLTVTTGMGYYSLRGRHPVRQEYSGIRSFTEIRWARFEEGGGRRMSAGFRTGGDVRNHTLSAAVSGVTLEYEAVGRIGEFPVLGRQATVYLGPAAGASVFSHGMNPVDAGRDPVISLSASLSAGAVSGVAIPLTSRLSAVVTGRCDPFSIGFRIVEQTASDLSSEKVHRAASATYGAAGIGFRYGIDDSVSVGLGYFAQFMRINSWDYLGISTSRLAITFSLHGWSGGDS